MITQALTLLQNPIYWESVDGTTIGPINSYLLMWPGFIGFPITYLTARLTGTILICIVLWFLFAGFQLIVSRNSARLGLLLLVFFFSFTTHFDFLHFSSELASLAFIAASWYFFLHFQLHTAFSLNHWNWLIAGLLIGCVPFAKLQSIPSAALIATAIVTTLFHVQHFNWRAVGKRLLLFLGGCSLPTVLLLAMCFYNHILDRFYTFYIQSNLLNYSEYNQRLYPATQLPLWDRILRLPMFFQGENTFYTLFLVCLISSVLALILIGIKRYPISRTNQWIGLWSIAWLGASLYSVIKPGTEFTHHLLILVLPLGWLIGMAAETFLSSAFVTRFQVLPLLMVSSSVLIWSQKFIDYRHDPASTHPYLYTLHIPSVPKNTAVSKAILHYAHPKDQLVVWGWTMRYHVETQLAQGTSENHSFRSITPHSLRKAYQNKYMEDISTNKPALFVDSTGPNSLWMTDTTVYKHERFTALANYISQNYQLVETVDHVRIYLRNDRIKSGSGAQH